MLGSFFPSAWSSTKAYLGRGSRHCYAIKFLWSIQLGRFNFPVSSLSGLNCVHGFRGLILIVPTMDFPWWMEPRVRWALTAAICRPVHFLLSSVWIAASKGEAWVRSLATGSTKTHNLQPTFSIAINELTSTSDRLY